MERGFSSSGSGRNWFFVPLKEKYIFSGTNN